MATGAEVGASAGSLLARVAANSVEEEMEVDAGMEVDAAAVAVEAPKEATMEAVAAGLLVAGLGGAASAMVVARVEVARAEEGWVDVGVMAGAVRVEATVEAIGEAGGAGGAARMAVGQVKTAARAVADAGEEKEEVATAVVTAAAETAVAKVVRVGATAARIPADSD